MEEHNEKLYILLILSIAAISMNTVAVGCSVWLPVKRYLLYALLSWRWMHWPLAGLSNLAGQKLAYKSQRLKAYRDKQPRVVWQHYADAKPNKLSDEDIATFAAYYSSLK